MNLNELIQRTASLHVLYVEDDLVLRENTVALLNDLFDHIDEANNGIDALEKYKASPMAYDIVITDLNMPHMNGIELIKQIKLLNSKQVIIIVSAHNETEYFLESIRNNVNGYILKPIDFDQLIETLFTASTLVEERKNESLCQTQLNQKLFKQHKIMQDFLTIDPLTQLHNASVLYDFLEQYESQHPLTLMLYNIDDFSLINQMYGSAFADEVLKKVAEYLSYNLSEEAHLYRYNSDEFVIVFNPSLNDPNAFAIQVQAFFRETPVCENDDESPTYLTLSCGIATSTHASVLLSNARTALREARLKGLPNQISIYNTENTSIQKSQSDTLWIQKLRSALEADRLIPYFQPIVDTKTLTIEKYECLARIEDKDDIIPPAYFLEAARRSGLMSSITRMMIHKVFKTFSGTKIHFSINLTSEDLLSDSFLDFVLAKQHYFSIDPACVTFEILENIILSDTDTHTLANLKRIKEMGYHLALDDFGSDRSNLNRLQALGIDLLKIDGQFIKGIANNFKSQSIVESITEMAHKMNIKVVAEYVSSDEELKMVQKLGIDYAQGYFLGIPENHLLKMIHS
ncbi:EAL domain-containing response regulator [Sulfurospirillum barnesii]|uniref:Diguanylate cyclase (GGDEF) domain-containing protein n=1 Tax=Sulfurospirillum barnesii (strain ATCC 700032 / DSM 10660 / SES-3) TaxID=760154 RepID=I3XWC6_SULBS|nr:EAL domain-containing response regulator [Sulfurospirillum barnesii]AFL68250.1 diguanylate cyclase (GGDEF) domain-containing protein [Sulfurospirillum barnesii SES-3]